MKIAYVTTYDATDIKWWSGTGFSILQTLKDEGLSIAYLGPLKEKYSKILTVKQNLYGRLAGKRYLREREPFVLKDYARQVRLKLSRVDADIVFSPGTMPIAYLECSQPIVFWADATFAGMVDFYPEFSKLCKESIRSGNAAEQSALENCKLAIYSSEWAARTAVDIYGISSFKVKVVPFGANISCNICFKDIERMVDLRPKNTCKLLFIGTNWARKGGDVALKVAQELTNSGLKTKLFIVGCRPDTRVKLPSYVKTIGFVNKSTKKGIEQMKTLLAESHFLVLPSSADCTPVVFSEANAFGVPCLTSNVGGIPTIIREGVNGKLFSVDSDISEYCTYISALFSDYSRYKKLALSSFKEYVARLNWRTSGNTVKNLLEDIISSHRFGN